MPFQNGLVQLETTYEEDIDNKRVNIRSSQITNATLRDINTTFIEILKKKKNLELKKENITSSNS